MTDPLESAIKPVADLRPPMELDADEAGSFEESLLQEQLGEFADEAAVCVIWAKYGL